VSVEQGTFDNWLEAFRSAWEAQDPDAAVAIFTPDASYQVSPFHDPLRGRDAIHSYWRRVTGRQHGVAVTAETLLVGDSAGVAQWRAHFTRPGRASDIDVRGVLVATLNDDGLCTDIRLWWERRDAYAVW
jgi:ketosteroid isomerase-like protein